MNRAFEKELSRALAAEPDTAVPETLLRRCRAEHVVKQRSGWRDLLLEGLGAGSNGGTGVVQCGSGTCPVGEGMDITQCTVWSEHTCHADSPARSTVFIPGKSI